MSQVIDLWFIWWHRHRCRAGPEQMISFAIIFRSFQTNSTVSRSDQRSYFWIESPHRRIRKLRLWLVCRELRTYYMIDSLSLVWYSRSKFRDRAEELSCHCWTWCRVLLKPFYIYFLLVTNKITSNSIQSRIISGKNQITTIRNFKLTMRNSDVYSNADTAKLNQFREGQAYLFCGNICHFWVPANQANALHRRM